MPSRFTPAINSLRESRRTSAAWSRLLIRPIRLHDGTVLFTLKDAAERILEMPASPSTRVAAERIIDAALRGGDMASTHAALRLALLKGAPAQPAAPRAEAGD
jgi:hypothetical protein